MHKLMRLSSLPFVGVILSSLLYFFSYPEVDPDLWGHLFFGREILQGWKLSLRNLYSYTAPDHPWINHEWLAEVIFYRIFSFFGSPGLILLKVLIGAMMIWMLDLIIKRRVVSPFVRVLTLVWTMAILSPGFNIRPQLFTYLFLVVLLFLFYRYEAGRRRVLYGIPFLMLFWVNLHGGFVAGLSALGLFVAVMIAAQIRGGAAVEQTFTQLGLPLGLSLLVLIVNPYGAGLLSFLWTDLLLSRPITEWEAVPLFDFSFPEFKFALVAVILISAWNRSYRRWDFILFLSAAFFAVRHQRHIPLFAVIAAPLLAEGVGRTWPWIRSQARESILALGIIAVAIYFLQGLGRVHLRHRFQLVVSPREYPTQASDFLRRNGVRGNLAVPFDWGEYLIWKLYPGIRVSIDGRYTTAYPMEVIQDNFEWMGGGRGWRRLLEHYPTEIAITKRYHPVTEHLRKDPAWVYIYSDPIAFIFVRETASQQELLAKFREKRLLPPQAPPIHFPG